MARIRNIYHVVPLDDTYEHLPFASCWCKPTEDPEEPDTLIHHAHDGREDYEEGRRKPH